jgi:class 3 adenylate cyclase
LKILRIRLLLYAYRAMILFMRLFMPLLIISALAIIVISLLPRAIPYIDNALSYKYIEVGLSIEKSLSSFAQTIVPTKVAGKDVTVWIFTVVAIVVVLFFGILFHNRKRHYSHRVDKLKMLKDYEVFKKKMRLKDDAKILAPLQEKLESLAVLNEDDRNELLWLFAKTKKKLDTIGRDLSFLSIDVVDSSGIKQGEEKASIEYTFREYKKLVEEKIVANGALKSSWTPDGVMVCFPTVDAAVRAAREVITSMEAFNEHVKLIRGDIRVRCGINSGYVYFDESIPMEEISDRVIDTAGHMQKHASPNTVCIAKPAIEPMKESEGFVPASRIVDGYEVYIWGKK